MDATDLARWQFAITTVYHFLFVPITIGLSGIVAVFHVRWVDPEAEGSGPSSGKPFASASPWPRDGIVQEFQFGMNWSDYSRFVGDIFGAPLAVEALLAFFLESVFLGLWIFGWGRIQRSARGDDVDRPHRHRAVGLLHPLGELVHAAPGRLHVQPGHRPRRVTDFCGPDQQGPS